MGLPRPAWAATACGQREDRGLLDPKRRKSIPQSNYLVVGTPLPTRLLFNSSDH